MKIDNHIPKKLNVNLLNSNLYQNYPDYTACLLRFVVMPELAARLNLMLVALVSSIIGIPTLRLGTTVAAMVASLLITTSLGLMTELLRSIRMITNIK